MEKEQKHAGSTSTSFSELPEGCLSEILSLTSPWDACRASSISLGFRPAADSDGVWERFLPSDYLDIIARSVSPVNYVTKKQLYFLLCDSPILLDDGNLSFYLDKKSGKKCYMLGARQLSISWGDTPLYWRWAPHIHSRFSEVVELLSVYWLDIRGKINTQILSPKTIYETYLVYKLANRSYGLVFARTSVRFVNERDDVPSVECSTAYIQPRRSVRDNQNVEFRRNRKDGWMELKTGEFINDAGDDGEVETRFMEIERLHAKSGLIVEGIEFRPKEGAYGIGRALCVS